MVDGCGIITELGGHGFLRIIRHSQGPQGESVEASCLVI